MLETLTQIEEVILLWIQEIFEIQLQIDSLHSLQGWEMLASFGL